VFNEFECGCELSNPSWRLAGPAPNGPRPLRQLARLALALMAADPFACRSAPELWANMAAGSMPVTPRGSCAVSSVTGPTESSHGPDRRSMSKLGARDPERCRSTESCPRRIRGRRADDFSPRSVAGRKAEKTCHWNDRSRAPAIRTARELTSARPSAWLAADPRSKARRRPS